MQIFTEANVRRNMDMFNRLYVASQPLVGKANKDPEPAQPDYVALIKKLKEDKARLRCALQDMIEADLGAIPKPTEVERKFHSNAIASAYDVLRETK